MLLLTDFEFTNDSLSLTDTETDSLSLTDTETDSLSLIDTETDSLSLFVFSLLAATSFPWVSSLTVATLLPSVFCAKLFAVLAKVRSCAWLETCESTVRTDSDTDSETDCDPIPSRFSVEPDSLPNSAA